MPEFDSPSEIAREVLRRLATERLQPTPENFCQYYHTVAGTSGGGTTTAAGSACPPYSDDCFPERQFKSIAAGLSRATPEQLRVARAFDDTYTNHGWQEFKTLFPELLQSLVKEPVPWQALLRELYEQVSRTQAGLAPLTKREAFERALDCDNNDTAALHSRLLALVKGWAQLPNYSPAPQAHTLAGKAETAAPPVPDAWRDLLAKMLETTADVVLVDAPELTQLATEISTGLRYPEDVNVEQLESRLHQFTYKAQWIALDQSHVRQALLKLLQLVIDNISDLVIEDKWLSGQLTVLRELFNKPLDKNVLEEMGERLRDVIIKQGALKRSLYDAQNRLREMLASFVDRLGDLADSTGVYHVKISAFADQIAKASSLDELSGVVEKILTETRQVEQSARSSQEELQLLRGTVEQANKDIQRLEKELEHASTLVRHDPLTGSLNRKGLEDMLTREVARMQRRNTKLCVAMLDVDNFKRLNDTFGHSTGDEALKHLAGVIRENLRPQDSSGRYGGEEFLLLLPDTTLPDAVTALQRLQRELTRRFFLFENQKVLITFSAGVTELHLSEPQEAAIDRADQAMYRAKRAGKNRVEST